jgi:putative oxidoreductase
MNSTSAGCGGLRFFGGPLHVASGVPLAILRVVLGVIFFAHGAQKMLGWFGGEGLTETLRSMHDLGISAPLAVLVIIVDLVGGVMLVIGLLGRCAALGILVHMAAGIAIVHRHFGFFMNWSGAQKGEGIEFNVLAMACAAAIVIGGSGMFSVDRAWSRPANP